MAVRRAIASRGADGSLAEQHVRWHSPQSVIFIIAGMLLGRRLRPEFRSPLRSVMAAMISKSSNSGSHQGVSKVLTGENTGQLSVSRRRRIPCPQLLPIASHPSRARSLHLDNFEHSSERILQRCHPGALHIKWLAQSLAAGRRGSDDRCFNIVGRKVNVPACRMITHLRCRLKNSGNRSPLDLEQRITRRRICTRRLHAENLRHA